MDHCLDRADETDSICVIMTKETCIRHGGNAGNMTMPLAWLQDGVQDCVDGRDEMNIWPTCGEVCEDAVVCPWGEPGYVELTNLCDGIETCGNENQICLESRASKVVEEFVFTSNKGLSKQFSYCLPGMVNLRKLKGDICNEESFIFPEHDFFGVDTKTFLLLPEGRFCNDNFENMCVALSKTCFVHKSSICDQTDHCLDRADETNSICGIMTKETCTRRGGNAGNMTMPLAWLQDGVQDCVDGRDEMNIWPTCGEVCEDAVVCPWGEPGYVELTNLCDGIETCGNENQICLKSRASKVVEEFVFTSNKGLSKQFSYCLPGMVNLRKLKGDI